MSDSWYPGALAAQDNYQPVDNPWLPDVGQPLISAGSRRISEGVPAVNQAMGALLAPRPRDPQSPVAYRTASPLVNISEQDIADATEAAMASSGGGLGIKAYHGSPHDFERFDLSKIGTGEGAQAYGHGLYFAENPEVARSYKAAGQPSYLGADRISAAQDILKEAGGDRRAALDLAQAKILGTTKYGEGKLWTDVLNNFDHLVGRTPGRMYEVDINADPAHFLDWDKPFTAQPQAIQNIIRGSGIHPEAPGPMGTKVMSDLPTGLLTGRRLQDPSSSLIRNLDKSGIPGIKYLDQQSRITPQLEYELARQKRNLALSGPDWGANSPEQIAKIHADIARIEAMMQAPKTSNYVVFNPGIIDIMRKYGIAGAAPLGIGALAAQDQYNQP